MEDSLNLTNTIISNNENNQINNQELENQEKVVDVQTNPPSDQNSSRVEKLCQVCGSQLSKYRCPACDVIHYFHYFVKILLMNRLHLSKKL